MDKEAGIGVVAVFLFMKHMIARDFWLGGGDSGAVVGQNHGIMCWDYQSPSHAVPSKLLGA